MAVRTIDVTSLSDLRGRGQASKLIDVRTPGEFGSMHIPGGVNVPLDRLDVQAIAAEHDGGEPIYLVCKGGTRSCAAAEKFIAAGHTNVVSVSGGTMAWAQAGLPVERDGRNVLPLDRQVQTAAGLIATTGMVLGTFVNPWFYVLAAIVGIGLTMAGLTGFCPMGILMARMPWNQGRDCGSCCSRPSAAKPAEPALSEK